MTKHISKLFWTILLLCAGMLFPAQAAPPAGQTWNLVWSDEFTNGTTLDTNLWGYGSTPWGSENQSACTLIPPEDTYVGGGNLTNRSRLGPFTGLSGTTYAYSSGWTWSKIWLAYGYLEIRAQYPNERGAWPAFWMLKSGWPPEIDIDEYRGTPKNYMTHALYDSTSTWHSSATGDTGGSFTGWHVYGLEWGPGYLKYYIDGVIQNTTTLSTVPSDPMYVILSNGSDCTDSDGTGFPNYFVIDYFRWYQVPPTNVPVTPTSLAATGGSNQVALNWPAMDRAAGYNVKRATVSGGPYTTIATTTGLTANRYDYPRDISPLAKSKPGDPTVVERFEGFIGGMELCNAFTELNDPLDQEARFVEMGREYNAEDEERHPMDEDYLRAMSYGMPPCGGFGMGIDRLAMLLTGQHSIREVLLFPHMKSKE